MQSTSEVFATLPRTSELAGRTAFVTGSTSGIGEAIAHALAAAGAHVLVSGRSLERAQPVVDAITALGGHATPLAIDLAAPYDQLRTAARNALAAAGGNLDVLVNNAGIYPVTATESLPDSDLDALLAVNVRAPHVLVGELVPAMAARGEGVVVNIGSWMARVGSPFGAMYTATKAALEQLTRAWAAEYGQRGVRVNTVAPGVTATPGNADAADVLAFMTTGTPAGKPVRPIDIAHAVTFLASPAATFVHGTTLDVDGGILTARTA